MSLRKHTIAGRPDLLAEVNRISPTVWPEFMSHDEVCNRFWRFLFEYFADCQLVFCDEAGTVVAMAHTAPMRWDGEEAHLPEGWDAAIEKAVRDREAGIAPTALLGLAVVVVPEHRSRGISAEVVRAMKSLSAERGLLGPVIPVRPVLKCEHPEVPMEEYITWRRDDGLPFDPWVRLHVRLGARILHVAPRSMVVRGTVGEWERWTGMRFPESGSYPVPGALSPVEINLPADLGIYTEPNVWMEHRPA